MEESEVRRHVWRFWLRALLMVTQTAEFNLSFDFFVSSSARIPVNVMDNLPCISEVPGGKITCLSSCGGGTEFFVHVGTSEGSVMLYRVTKRQTQSRTDFFESVRFVRAPRRCGSLGTRIARRRSSANAFWARPRRTPSSSLSALQRATNWSR